MKPGEVVAGRYRLDARLGIGGMGEVWRATHEATAREFAIKFMHAHAASSASGRQRFAREARISARINHPNVIDVFDAGEHEEGTLFLAMELLDGISLADAFHLAPPLSVQDLLVVMHDTARALSAAHAVGIVHRDIKPANVFLHRERASGFASAKVLDFGISKFGTLEDSHQTKTGAVLGSPRYMSPEQTRSAASVDHRADVWASGVILFEGLTGTWPHEGDSFSSLVVAICTQPPASIDSMAADLPESVRSIVRGCLQPIERRIQTADELAARLVEALQDPTLAQRPLARPLHPPSDSIRATTGVRVRPLLTTTGSGPDSLTRSATDLRASQSRPLPLQAAAPAPSPAAQPGFFHELLPDEDVATRPIPPELVAKVFGRLPLPTAALPQVPPPALPPPAAPAAVGPSTPLHAVQHKTVPLDTAMHAQLVQMGLVAAANAAPAPATPVPMGVSPMGAPPPGARMGVADPVSGTFESLPANAPSPPPVPGTPTFGAAPVAPSPPRASGLRIAAAALSVLLAVIIVALVSVVRSGPPVQPSPAAASAPVAAPSAPPAAPSAPPAVSTPSPVASAEGSAAPAASPAATVSATTPPPTAAPASSATVISPAPAAPAEKPRSAPARPSPTPAGGSKVKQLGSGL